MKQGPEVRLYRIWVSMKNRCQNPRNYVYYNYGGRGVTVCAKWQAYEPFADWAKGHGYADDLTIERIDNNSAYCLKNCRWATCSEQNNNTRQNRFVTYKGRIQTMRQWADELGMPYALLSERIRKG